MATFLSWPKISVNWRRINLTSCSVTKRMISSLEYLLISASPSKILIKLKKEHGYPLRRSPIAQIMGLLYDSRQPLSTHIWQALIYLLQTSKIFSLLYSRVMQFLQVPIIFIAFSKKSLTITMKERMMLNNNDTCEEGDKYCKKGRLQRAGAGESPAQGVCRNNTPEHQPEPPQIGQ
ncbi:hypothetical protein SDC9_47940 [bioreactor metagenome]|uniref:Uncharacterized protein n=1 Tax=bioreactor metagenome TaxID=1076179 RepID=A0A644WD19_9ZZZZ